MFGGKDPDNPNGHSSVSDIPNDTISCLRFSPSADLFALTSWNNEVRVYRYDPQNGQAQPMGGQKCDRAPLWCEWSADGNHLFTGGFDNTVRMWELNSNKFGTVGRHDAGVKSVAFERTNSMVVSGGLDNQVIYWDLRQGKAAGKVDMRAKVFAMSLKGQCLAVALSDMKVKVYNTSNPTRALLDKKTNLKQQLRTIDLFPDSTGFAIASVEGRTAIEYFDKSRTADNFSFKCHRQQRSNRSNTSDCYPVNTLRFHPVVTGTFATCGADGQVNFWDKTQRQRLKFFERLRLPITAVDFDRTGSVLAYASSYDWHAGMAGYERHKTFRAGVFLHGVTADQVTPKPKGSGGRT